MARISGVTLSALSSPLTAWHLPVVSGGAEGSGRGYGDIPSSQSDALLIVPLKGREGKGTGTGMGDRRSDWSRSSTVSRSGHRLGRTRWVI